MSLKGLTSYYNCVKNSVRILYIQFLSNFRLKSAGYGLRPVATIYTSRERAREESGLRTLTFVNRERISRRYSSKPSPWNTFTTKLPPGANTSRDISSASSTRYIAREYPPPVFRTYSAPYPDMTTWTLLSPTRSSNAFRTNSSRKSPLKEVHTQRLDPLVKIASDDAAAVADLRDRILRPATGSSTEVDYRHPRLKILSLCCISSSLNQARERNPFFCAC